MKKQKKIIFAATIISALQASYAGAHLEPKKGDGTEKCYGVAKAHKNDCMSKLGKHLCAGMAKVDNSPNDWVKAPIGLCDKLVGGIVRQEPETKEQK